MESEVIPQNKLPCYSDLFKLYKVYSWADGSEEIVQVPVFPLSSTRRVDDEVDDCVRSTEISLESYDMELAKEMDALGLPLAFSSSNKSKSKKKNRIREKAQAIDLSHLNEEADLCSQIEKEPSEDLSNRAKEKNSSCCNTLGSCCHPGATASPFSGLPDAHSNCNENDRISNVMELESVDQFPVQSKAEDCKDDALDTTYNILIQWDTLNEGAHFKDYGLFRDSGVWNRPYDKRLGLSTRGPHSDINLGTCNCVTYDDELASAACEFDVHSSCLRRYDSQNSEEPCSARGSNQLLPENVCRFEVAYDDSVLGMVSSSVNSKFDHLDISFNANKDFEACTVLTKQNPYSGAIQVTDTNYNLPLNTPTYATCEILTSCNNTKKRRTRRSNKKSNVQCQDLQAEAMSIEYFANISKYWSQRYLLFSRFDDGIRMDEEGWFSVTPEAIATHHASFCVDEVVIDCFTGVGGNAIKFAERCRHVIAIDIDPIKIEYASHNTAIYNVQDKIDFVTGDFFTLAPSLKADTVFLSPPWGGPEYTKVKVYDLKTMLKPYDGLTLFQAARKISTRVIMFLPKNIELQQLIELSESCSPPWSLEVEKNFLNGKLKAITAYFSDTTVRGHE